MVKDRFAKQLWISVGVILGSIAIATGVLVFLTGEMTAQANIIVSDRQAIQEKTEAVATLVQLEAAVPLAAQYQKAITQLIPDQYTLVTFPQWLSGLGAKYNVTTDAVLQGSPSQATGATAGVAQFSFTADGAPSDLSAFLNSMNAKSSVFLLSLGSFSVTSDGTNQKVTGQGTLFSR
jgi:hypothetical protein